MKHVISYFFAFLFFFSFATNAQTAYELASEGNKIQVIGTSNLHDWEMVSEEIKGNAELYIEEGEITGIKKIVITMATTSLVSEKNGLNKNAYKTFDAENNPVISFIAFDMGPNGEASGILNVAGYDKDIDFAYTYEFKAGQLHISCEADVTFSDFGMKAPSILAGTIKTAEEVQLKMQFVLVEASKP